jgi:hypothetical protein
MTSLRDAGAASAALELAARGWPVLPVRGKVPKLHNGLLGASTDERAITNWWQLWPDCGVGVRTGAGLVVLDVDGDAGADALHDLERRHGELPRTVTVRTGGGGEHYYFACREPVRNSAGRLGAGLDVRGEGGYVIAPPSRHDSGSRYEWDEHPDDVPVAALPTWLLGMLREDTARRKRTPTSEWVRLIRAIPEGQRNDGLARLCGHLLARGVDEHVMHELLLAVNQSRCRPPLPDREVTHIAESILRRHLRKAPA